MAVDVLPPQSDADAAIEVRRRIRRRNAALSIVLIGLVALFYAISIVKFKVH
jgi:hypothetical protein